MAGEVLAAFPKAGSQLAAAIEEVSARLGINPVWLAAVINFESGFDPQAKNPYSGARGLIQFMPSTAKGLGTTTDAIAALSALDQMPLVERYFQPYRGKMGSLADVCMAVFFPRYIGKDPSTPFPEKVQQWNPGIRTPADYAAKVVKHAGTSGRSYL